MTRPWPNLLYFGDVPVQHTYHGSALLYRLFERVPADRLVVVESHLFPSVERFRLPGVRYRRLRIGSPRLLNSRFHSVYSHWLMQRAPRRAASVLSASHGFRPEGVVTVAHGYAWVTAAVVARSLRIPLHLILHDDWPRIVSTGLRPQVDAVLASTYRQAASRLCVSPGMEENYRHRYGVPGTVLLPGRRHSAPVFDGPPDHLRHRSARPVFAFAGTINSPGYAALLRRIAAALARRGGEMHIFGPLTAANAAASGLSGPAIVLRGLLTPEALLDQLRRDINVVVVPMSFAEADRPNMELSFPSKLTDYTAAGVPMLICGPAYCSAVRWATGNPDVAEVVTSDDEHAIDMAVGRLLARDPQSLVAMAAAAQRVGNRDFSAAAAEAVFQRAVTGAA